MRVKYKVGDVVFVKYAEAEKHRGMDKEYAIGRVVKVDTIWDKPVYELASVPGYPSHGRLAWWSEEELLQKVNKETITLTEDMREKLGIT